MEDFDFWSSSINIDILISFFSPNKTQKMHFKGLLSCSSSTPGWLTFKLQFEHSIISISTTDNWLSKCFRAIHRVAHPQRNKSVNTQALPPKIIDTSRATFQALPYDVILEILSWLSVNSKLSLSYTCKYYRDFFQDMGLSVESLFKGLETRTVSLPRHSGAKVKPHAEIIRLLEPCAAPVKQGTSFAISIRQTDSTVPMIRTGYYLLGLQMKSITSLRTPSTCLSESTRWRTNHTYTTKRPRQ